ncbi:MAG: hypothetical protein U1E60_21395 [Reyranellaceae bacterium]
MSLEWKISHPDRLVIATAEGTLTPAEIEHYLDDVVTSDALVYRKIFDVTQAVFQTSDDEMMALGARIRAYPAFGRLGPLAIVVASEQSRWQARMFSQLAEVDRPLKIFRTVGAARKWLDAQPDVSPSAKL